MGGGRGQIMHNGWRKWVGEPSSQDVCSDLEPKARRVLELELGPQVVGDEVGTHDAEDPAFRDVALLGWGVRCARENPLTRVDWGLLLVLRLVN